MKIGELARRAGCPVETVRYYEKAGLLPETVRTASNYRVYDAGHLERLVFIRNCRTLEMSLEEIGLLLALKDRPGDDCGRVVELLERHMGHVDERIARLTALKGQLHALQGQCARNETVERCGILRGLAGPLASPVAGPRDKAGPEREKSHLRGCHGREG
jgi:Cd(II)/Pb(II)-responsive transcriptional regulator